jgi:hypothetical protein
MRSIGASIPRTAELNAGRLFAIAAGWLVLGAIILYPRLQLVAIVTVRLSPVRARSRVSSLAQAQPLDSSAKKALLASRLANLKI